MERWMMGSRARGDMWQRSRGGFELVMLWWNPVRAQRRPLPADSPTTASFPRRDIMFSYFYLIWFIIMSDYFSSESLCRFRGSVSCDPADWPTDTFVACDTKSGDTVDAGWTETDLCCRTSVCDSRRKHKHREDSQTGDCSCGAATITVVIASARNTHIMYVGQHYVLIINISVQIYKKNIMRKRERCPLLFQCPRNNLDNKAQYVCPAVFTDMKFKLAKISRKGKSLYQFYSATINTLKAAVGDIIMVIKIIVKKLYFPTVINVIERQSFIQQLVQ